MNIWRAGDLWQADRPQASDDAVGTPVQEPIQRQVKGKVPFCHPEEAGHVLNIGRILERE